MIKTNFEPTAVEVVDRDSIASAAPQPTRDMPPALAIQMRLHAMDSRKSGPIMMEAAERTFRELMHQTERSNVETYRGGVTDEQHYWEASINRSMRPGEELVRNRDGTICLIPFTNCSLISEEPVFVDPPTDPRQTLLSTLAGVDVTAEKAAAARAARVLKSFPFDGAFVLTNQRCIVFAANPSSSGTMTGGRGNRMINGPSCIDMVAGCCSCGRYNAFNGSREYTLSYTASDNTVLWSSPLSYFKPGLELRVRQGSSMSQTISSHMSCLDRMWGFLDCCGGESKRRYTSSGIQNVVSIDERTVTLPLLAPPWEGKAVIHIDLPTQADRIAICGGREITNAVVQEFLSTFEGLCALPENRSKCNLIDVAK
jgi:hypothetical protein